MKVIVPETPSPRELVLPGGSVIVDGGETIDVPADVGKNLIEQGWRTPKRASKEGED